MSKIIINLYIIWFFKINCVLCDDNDGDSFHMFYNEESLHVFFKCPSSSVVWQICPLSSIMNTIVNQSLNVSGIIFHIL